MKGLDYYLNTYAVPAAGAIAILIIGLFLIKFITKRVSNRLEKKDLDPSLVRFVSSITLWGLRILLLLTVISLVGIPITSFVAILGAAGLAIGLALQGTLSNFAGGILVLIFKPYKTGDVVEFQGVKGVVDEIQIFNTIIVTADKKTIFVPNGAIMNGNITNFTKIGVMRIDMVIGISYDSDIKTAKQILLEILNNNPLVLKDPAATVTVGALADSSVNLNVRPFCLPADYWTILADTLEESKYKLEEAGVGIPYPQMDVHVNK